MEQTLHATVAHSEGCADEQDKGPQQPGCAAGSIVLHDVVATTMADLRLFVDELAAIGARTGGGVVVLVHVRLVGHLPLIEIGLVVVWERHVNSVEAGRRPVNATIEL
jgi:hypothetical protein